MLCSSSVDIMHQPEKDHTYAFVKFEHISSAEAALKLHGATLGSKTLVMSYSRRGGDMPEPGGICREYQRGTCTFGSSCRFVHEERTAVLTVPMVYVGNLTDTATEDDLQGFFEEQIGGCASVQLKKQADGSIYAFVRFHDIALAEQVAPTSPPLPFFLPPPSPLLSPSPLHHVLRPLPSPLSPALSLLPSGPSPLFPLPAPLATPLLSKHNV